MTIARIEYDGVGARIYAPEGPFGLLGQAPFQNFRPGSVLRGDSEAEFVYVLLQVMSPTIMNQGDMLIWDQNYRAVRSLSGAGSFQVGDKLGALFLGGGVGDVQASVPPVPPALFSANFTLAGVYGVFAQRTGASLVNAAAGAAAGIALSTSAVSGQVATAAPVGSFTIAPGSGVIMPAAVTFTANTTAGSPNLTNCSSNFSTALGDSVSGAGIPTGCYIKDIQGPVIVLSAAATATAAGVTITSSKRATVGTTVSGSPVITNVPNIPQIFPNQTITGTGIPASTTILYITGVPGNYSITLSANATAAGTNVALTTSGYLEAILNEPAIATAN